MGIHGSVKTEKISENEVLFTWNTNSCVKDLYYDTALTSPAFVLTLNSTAYKCYFTACVEKSLLGGPSYDAKKIEVNLYITSYSIPSQKYIVCETGFQCQKEKQRVSKQFDFTSQVNTIRILSLNSCLTQNLPIIVCKLMTSDSLEFQRNRNLSSLTMSHKSECSKSNTTNNYSQDQGKWSFLNPLPFFSGLKSRFNCFQASSFATQNGNIQKPKIIDQNMIRNLINEKRDKITKNPKHLIQDMTILYFKGLMSDMVIRVGEVSLPAHKLILSARSPVFKKMLVDSYHELNCITITDYNFEVFQKFLKYIYTDDLEGVTIEEEMALYSLAYKYDVDGLKISCSELMQIELNFSDVHFIAAYVCDILKLAHLHSDLKLKSVAVTFILKHFSVVGSGKSWNEMMKTDPELTSKVLVNLTANNIANLK